ncbi:MAG TPA: Gfo/Idh/MocA family oxidoreductase [Nitrososphaera sp.]|jgi:UDP-N-acetylglucosamine 3-dehydrogenase|nr:Gfo/Idh/MocA family oxidoreductase [Nitrososphaera sp.]
MVDASGLGLAVIGVGGWGKNHARVLNDFGCLAAICDVDGNRARELADKYGARSYSSLDEMLDKERLDGCLVCTPTKTHSAVARKVMDRGINTFVEKPMSFSSQECEEMTEAAEKKKVILTSGYVERFNPVVSNTKKLIEGGMYGDPMMIEFHRENRMPLHIKDVGIIYDTSVHDIDAAMFLFGTRPNVVFARAGKRFHSFEDFATIMLGFEGQKVAVIASNWLTPKKVRTFSAVCTDGIITGDFLTQEIRIDHADATIVPRNQFQEPLTLELRNFIDSIQGKASIVVSASDATNVTRVAEAAILSSNTGSPVYLDLKQ